MNNATTTESKLGGGQAWINWLLATAYVVFVFTLQTGYAITNVSMSEDLGLSLTQVGFIGSIYTWAFALAQFTSGSIMDRLGSRWVIPMSSAVVTVGAFLFASATGPVQLTIAQVLMAVGASFGFVGAGFVGGQWFAPLKYGFMFALVQFVASLSAILGQNTIGALIQSHPWSNIIYGMAYSGLALTVVMFLVMRDPQRADLSERAWSGVKNFCNDLFEALGQCMAIRDTWINAVIGGATFGTMLSLGVIWGPRYLIAAGMEQGAAYSVSATMWLGLAVSAPLFAKWSEWQQSRKIPMFAGCLAQLIAIIVILARPEMSLNEAYFWFFIWGFMSGGSMLNFPIGADLVPVSLIGTSAAIVNAIQFIIGGIMMAVPGRVLSGTGLIARVQERVGQLEGPPTGTVGDYQWALAVIPITLFLACLLFLALSETYPKEQSKS